MSIAAEFGQKQHTDVLEAASLWLPVDLAVGERLVSLVKLVTGRGLLIAGTAAVVLIISGLPVALGFVGNNSLASRPKTIIAVPPPPTTVGQWRQDDSVQPTKNFKVSYQEAIDILAVQDVVVSQQAELRRLSHQVAALTAKLKTIERAATYTPKPSIGPPSISPKTAPPRSHY
jgi:uncharacterized coiled-coil protein SlyX